MNALDNFKNWKPEIGLSRIKTIEMHTGGEPLRVIVEGLPQVQGNTILEKRAFFKEKYDDLRTALMWEPRGHADMYGAVITEPVTEDGHFGTFFIHNDGYSTMCGHAVIALTKLAFESGVINEGEVLRIDAPPGRIEAIANIENGAFVSASFVNVPSFVLLSNKQVEVDGFGKIDFDVAYGGAFYAFVEADKYNIALMPENVNQLIDLGRKIKHAIWNNFDIVHPVEEDLSFLYGTIFIGKPKIKEHFSRNVCIFANGEVDRSATGSGVSARAALHFSKGELQKGQNVVIESILGTTMNVQINETVDYQGYSAVVPEVSGTAFITGRSEFFMDPNDTLKKGFIFR